MTDWPADDKTLSFWELTEPVCTALKEIYTMKRKNHGDIEWTGPAMPEFLAASSLPFDERLSKGMLDYDEQDQGREPLEILVGIAVQLGMEQERRVRACRDIDRDLVSLALGLMKRELKDDEPSRP